MKKKKKIKDEDKSIDSENTTIYKPIKAKKGKNRKKKKHPRLKMFFKVMFVTFLLVAMIGGRNTCCNII